MIEDSELLRMASAFDLIEFDPNRRGIRELSVVKRNYDPPAWAITSQGQTLTREGEWEFEPRPSSRDEDYLARARWPNPVEAIEFAREHMKKYPTGYKE